MIKDIIDNFVNQLQNEENQQKVSTALNPWLLNIKLFCYVVVFLLLIISINLSAICYKISTQWTVSSI